MEQYIGDKKVFAIVDNMEEQTPVGNKLIKVMFEGNIGEIMPKLRFDLLVSNEPSDATALKKHIVGRVAAICFGSFHEYGVKMGEVNSILDAITALVNDGFTKAQDIMWGVDYPGIPLININKVLLENHAKQSPDGIVSTGSGFDK